MMNLDNYYLHGTGGINGFNNNKNTIIDILKCGYIKTSEELKISVNGTNKDNEICLCDSTIEPIYINNLRLKSSFEDYIKTAPSIALKKKLSVICPIRVKNGECTKGNTDMYDEVRHIGNISLENMEFITFPIIPWYEMFKLKKIDNIDNNYLKNLFIYKDNIEYISKKFSDVKMVNLYNGKQLTSKDVSKSIAVYKLIKRI